MNVSPCTCVVILFLLMNYTLNFFVYLVIDILVVFMYLNKLLYVWGVFCLLFGVNIFLLKILFSFCIFES